MSLIDDLNSIGSFTVGTGGGASPAYPVLSITARHERYSDGAQAAGQHEHYQRVTWTIRSLGLAASSLDANITALNTDIQTALARRGLAVTVTERGASRTLPAEGGTAGSLPGYPRCSVSLDPEPLSCGPWQSFVFTAESVIPAIPGSATSGYYIVDHPYETTTSEDELGYITTKRTGSIRVRMDQSAAAAAEAIVLGPARTAAAAAFREFRASVKVSGDASFAEYDYSDTEVPGAELGGGSVTSAEVTDATVRTREGRLTRTVSGFGVGSGAAAFAASRKPSLGTNELLVRSDVSAPTEPDGRVNFTYEVLKGWTDAGFSGLVVYGFQQELEPTAGGRDVVEVGFPGTAPLLYLGPIAAFRYRQIDTLEFTGTWPADLATAFPLRFDANRQSGITRVRKESDRQGIRRITVERLFVYDSAQAIPDPREVVATL